LDHRSDIINWFLGLDRPSLATSIGASNSNGVRETPDTVRTLMVCPEGVQAHFEGTFCNAFGGEHILFMGTEANLYLNRGRLELIPSAARAGPRIW
jgi:hypothetical protein